MSTQTTALEQSSVESDSFRSMIGNERQAFLRWPPFYIAVAFVVVAAVGRYLFEYVYIVNGPPAALALKHELYPISFSTSLMTITNLTLEGMGIILGCLAIGSLRWRSSSLSLPQTTGLSGFSARVLAFTAATGVIVLTLFAVSAISSVVVATMDGVPIVWPSALEILKAFGVICYVLLCYGTLGMLLAAAITRWALVAIGVGLVYITYVEQIPITLLDHLHSGAYRWIEGVLDLTNAWQLSNAIAPQVLTAAQYGRDVPAGPFVIAPIQTVLVLGVYMIGALSLTGMLLRRRERSPGMSSS